MPEKPHPASPDSPPRAPTPRRVAVLVLPHVHLLDLAGPVQALYEANGFGADYRLVFCASKPEVVSAQGLVLGKLAPLPPPRGLDLVLVAGIESSRLDSLGATPSAWLRECHASGVLLASVCSGAFVLARAGLLDGRDCTTHWKALALLQERAPRARVLDDRLFVRDGNVITSAGEASGIDMALSLILEDHGPHVTARVAREMVVYVRRDGEQRQSSVLLEHRTHLRHGVHLVQDWIVANPHERATLAELGRIAAMSPRNLTRAFRQATGISVKAFTHRVKLEVASQLLADPRRSVEDVATRCGFMDARQLRRLWRQAYGTSPGRWKSGRRAAETPRGA
jgi:transcriptional regulator GlxA family with amidase domain